MKAKIAKLIIRYFINNSNYFVNHCLLSGSRYTNQDTKESRRNLPNRNKRIYGKKCIYYNAKK